MSLYIDAASVLEASLKGQGTLKSLTYSNKTLRNKPAHVYALVSQAAKWASVLKEVIENSEGVGRERKLSPALALLLTHDLLLSKSGVAAPTNHPLKLAISKHQARLRGEFTKFRVRRGIPSVDEFRAWVEKEATRNPILHHSAVAHPRWVRINSVKTTLQEQLKTTFADYREVQELSEVLAATSTTKIYHLDKNVPLLLAFPPRTEVTKTTAYENGELILQDKASCFPGVLLANLDPDSDVVDACAAPGNKTSQLGELVYNISRISATGDSDKHTGPKVYAFEKDPNRAKILIRMMERAGLSELVTTKPAVDFLTSNPNSKELRNVSALLLDPSCSGSGIVNRDGHLKIELPTLTITPVPARGVSRKPGSKTPSSSTPKPTPSSTPKPGPDAEDEVLAETDPKVLAERLALLSSFQLRIIEHSMTFPSATRISYSTCSIHCEENEDVVLKALNLPIAKEKGWKLWTRQTQPEGMRIWNRRGLSEWPEIIRAEERSEGEGMDLEEIREGCIRCSKDTTDEGTMGFFLAGFVRGDVDDGEGLTLVSASASIPPLSSVPSKDGVDEMEVEDADLDEWEGFSDSE